MQRLSTITKPETNGSGTLLPSVLHGQVKTPIGVMVADLVPITSENSGNTRWEWVDYIEVESAKEGIALLKSLAAKYEGELLVPGSVHKSTVKNKVGKGGTAYSTGGNDTVTHELDHTVVIAGREYRVTMNGTVVERSRNKVKYLCATISMKVQIVGGFSNGPKSKGSTTVIEDADW